MFKIKKFSYFIISAIFIISVVVVASLNIYNTNSLIDEKIEFFKKSGYVKLDNQIELMLDRLNIIKENTDTISKIILREGKFEKEKLSKIIKTHFSPDLGIFQSRILDQRGREVIRYDLKDGRVVPATFLQDKSSRYYYTDAKNIDYGDIYISKFDLNMEKGYIEIPYKNTVRLVKRMKLDNQDYYLIINYDITKIFRHALSTTLYEIFLIEKDDGQINMHLDDSISFSKQKGLNKTLENTLDNPTRYITMKNLPGYNYNVVILIKKNRMLFIKNQREGTIIKSLVITVLISVLISFIILYILERNLLKFNDHALSIIKYGTYNVKDEFDEFKQILQNLQVQNDAIQKNKKYASSILDSQSNFTIVTDGKELNDANKTMLNFFGFMNVNEFTKVNDCICDYFIKKDGYLQKEVDGRTWIEEMLLDPDANYKVLIKDLSGALHTYQVKLSDLITDDKLFVVTFTDITELLELQNELEDKVSAQLKELREKDRQLLEQSKMSSLGEMLGNIAHQWRQPLTVITTNVTGMQTQKEYGVLDDEKFDKACDSINHNAQYLSNIIDTFRDFLGNDQQNHKSVVQEIINETLIIVADTLDNKNINVEKHLPKEEVVLNIAKANLSQVLVNIINNAHDIFVERETNNPTIDLNMTTKNNELIITIEDNAGGIPEDIIGKVFEPYFTTKHKSRGVGLGLHLSYKIITESLKGKLYVQNTTKGAKFFIELPL